MSVVFDLSVFDRVPDADLTATVTPLGGVAVQTTVQWDQEPSPPADQMVGAGPSAATNRRVLAWVRRDHVPTLPIGSTLVGGPAHRRGSTWKVVSLDASDPEYHIAVVV